MSCAGVGPRKRSQHTVEGDEVVGGAEEDVDGGNTVVGMSSVVVMIEGSDDSDVLCCCYCQSLYTKPWLVSAGSARISMLG